ncbi:MAG: hypothetical protein ACJ72H_32035 [Candidatus Sulfotelmatobacter sp.]|jgi:hypothetical protein
MMSKFIANAMTSTSIFVIVPQILLLRGVRLAQPGGHTQSGHVRTGLQTAKREGEVAAANRLLGTIVLVAFRWWE